MAPPLTTLTRTNEPPAGGVVDLGVYLRTATAAAHIRLEASLDLLDQTADAARFRRVLERFHGFHKVWEPALAAQPTIAEFHAARSRMTHLRHDLAAFGLTQDQIAGLPSCRAAAELVASREAALGSLYVMEGSTLGGQVIARRLAQTDWAPPEGLTYFQPYGARTGEMWREFKVWSDNSVTPTQHQAVAAGANRTFDLLHDWLTA